MRPLRSNALAECPRFRAAIRHRLSVRVDPLWVIDAPHTGALVRFDDADWPDLVGATRPG
jgi:hypothetical protein